MGSVKKKPYLIDNKTIQGKREVQAVLLGLFQTQDMFNLQWFFLSENLVIPSTAITLTTTKHADRSSFLLFRQ